MSQKEELLDVNRISALMAEYNDTKKALGRGYTSANLKVSIQEWEFSIPVPKVRSFLESHLVYLRLELKQHGVIVK